MNLRLVFLIPLVLGPFIVFGADLDELRFQISEKNKQIAELEKEISEFQQEIEKTSEEADSLKNQINAFTATISKLSREISVAQRKIETAELSLEELGIQIAGKASSIDQFKDSLAEIIRNMDELESQSLVEIMLAHASLSNFFSDVDYIENLSSEMEIRLAELKSAKSELESEKNKKEELRAQLRDLQSEFNARKSIEENARRQKNDLLKITQNKEAEYQELLKDREAQREAVLNEIQEIEDELRKLIDPESLPEAREGVLAWPIKGAVLTQSYGVTPYSEILYNGKPHNGIDIRAQIGTPVYAAEDGIVMKIGDTDAFPRCLSYGKWVLIKHPNNLATLYAHLSLIKVNNNDIIKRGELMGYSGDTGYATGPHLHFTVYDANTVEFRPSSLPKSTCKLLPFGGYLNPMAYL
ncbi:MAG: peptidoglycan DD-metalloendopeptidase family protein [Candidatus Niyogibacteria bacterium]|nr:MAG: peptidoglycan DD-metalloendopeptidase family protein [Candidatus Niyogibacteria bacterium]